MPEAGTSTINGGAPDWAALEVELHCPRCGYDLRLLPEPRCPECGLRFEWSELIRATRQQLDSPLFEYQWRRRPVRSLLGTLGRAMLPWMLWRRVPLALEPRVGPLLALLLAAIVLHAVICGAAEYTSDSIVLARAKAYMAAQGWSPIPISVGFPGAWAWSLVGALTLVLLMWLVLQIFQQTVQRYRIRQRHFLRVFVFAAAGMLLWHAAACSVTPIFAFAGDAWITTRSRAIAALVMRSSLLGSLMFALSVALGLRSYLRIRRGGLMAVCACVIIGLLIIAPVPASVADAGLADSPYVQAIRRLWPWMEIVVQWLLG